MDGQEEAGHRSASLLVPLNPRLSIPDLSLVLPLDPLHRRVDPLCVLSPPVAASICTV